MRRPLVGNGQSDFLSDGLSSSRPLFPNQQQQQQTNAAGPTSNDSTYDCDSPIPSIEGVDNNASIRPRQDAERRPSTPSVSPTPSAFRFSTPTTALTPTSDRGCTASPMTQNIAEVLGGLSLNEHEPASTGRRTSSPRSVHEVNGDTNDSGLVAGFADMTLTPRHMTPSASRNAERLTSPSVCSDTFGISPGNTPTQRVSYKIEEEKAPNSIFDDKDFQSALQKAQAVVNSLTTLLSTDRSSRGSEMQNHYKRAQTLRNFQSPVKRIIGLVGDSGVGKSRLISSLLNMRNFVRSSGNGGACTCVATEFSYHEDNDFVLEVEYYTQEELEMQFTRLLLAYKQDPSSTDRVGYAKETEDLKKQINLARDTFVATFGPEILHQLSSLQEESVKGLVQERLKTLSISTPSCERFSKSTACSDRLSQLTSMGGTDAYGHAWPLIRKICVKLKAHILSKGLILVDLPGLRDINVARVNTTEKYLRQCHQIFSVCHIKRAITDQGVNDVFELAGKAKLSDVAIVCTHSDEVDASETKKDIKSAAANIQQLEYKIEKTLKNINDMEDEICDLEADLNMCTDDYDESDPSNVGYNSQRAELRSLLSKKGLYHNTEKKQRANLQQFLIKTRNEIVASKVHGTWPNHPHVFCVSNKIYDEHIKRSSREQELWIDLSGIPKMRKHCLSVVDRAKVEAAKTYMLHGVPSLISSLRIWVESGAGTLSVEQKQRLRAGVEEAKSALDLIATAESTNLQNVLLDVGRQQITHVPCELFIVEALKLLISKAPKIEDWAAAGKAVVQTWQGYQYNTIQAFCRRSGQWKKGGQMLNWNEEAIASMYQQMTPYWRRLLEVWSEAQISFLNQCSAAFKSARTSVSSSKISTSVLEKALGHRERLFISTIETFLTTITNDLEQLNFNALGATASAFTVQRMQSTYDGCARDMGTGVKDRMLKLLEARVGSKKLFKEISQDVKMGFDIVVEKLTTGLESSISEHLSGILQDMDALLNENTITESENNPALRNALGSALNVADDEIRRVQAMVAAF